MAFDLDAWAERAAIMEYDAGMSRFVAETRAAQDQGVERHDAIKFRDTAKARHKRAKMARESGEKHMP